MKKRAFSLVEVMASFTLIALLISTLTGIYFTVQGFNRQQERDLQKAVKETFLHQKLLKTFLNTKKVNLPGLGVIGGLTLSEGEGGSLILTFDNGPDPKSHYFSNTLLSRLYVDEKKHLILATWPDPSVFSLEESKDQFRKEILFDGVQRMEFSFYRPPVVDSNKIIDLDASAYGWQKEWKFEDKDLPAMIKVSLDLQEFGRKDWVFYLPSAKKQVIFREG